MQVQVGQRIKKRYTESPLSLYRALTRNHLHRGRLVNIAPGHALLVELSWHCWNLDSAVLDALTAALTGAAAESLR
jgi:hypothetical protein